LYVDNSFKQLKVNYFLQINRRRDEFWWKYLKKFISERGLYTVLIALLFL